MPERHEIEVRIDPGRLGKFDATFRAQCSCGWVSPRSMVRPQAVRDGDKHIAQRVAGGTR